MAAELSFVHYACELLQGVGPCVARRMFGGFGISCSGLNFALVVDLGHGGGGEKLWLKTSDDTRALFEAAGCERFVYSVTRQGVRHAQSMNYYSAPEEAMESAQLMLPWARLALDCALKARLAQSPRARVATKKIANKVPPSPAASSMPQARRPGATAAGPRSRRKSGNG